MEGKAWQERFHLCNLISIDPEGLLRLNEFIKPGGRRDKVARRMDLEKKGVRQLVRAELRE